MIYQLKIRKNISGSNVKKGKYKESNTFCSKKKKKKTQLRSLVNAGKRLLYVSCSKF